MCRKCRNIDDSFLGSTALDQVFANELLLHRICTSIDQINVRLNKIHGIHLVRCKELEHDTSCLRSDPYRALHLYKEEEVRHES